MRAAQQHVRLGQRRGPSAPLFMAAARCLLPIFPCLRPDNDGGGVQALQADQATQARASEAAAAAAAAAAAEDAAAAAAAERVLQAERARANARASLPVRCPDGPCEQACAACPSSGCSGTTANIRQLWSCTVLLSVLIIVLILGPVPIPPSQLPRNCRKCAARREQTYDGAEKKHERQPCATVAPRRPRRSRSPAHRARPPSPCGCRTRALRGGGLWRRPTSAPCTPGWPAWTASRAGSRARGRW